MDAMQYIYVFLWAALAVMTVVAAHKEGLLCLAAAAFFVFMTVWYGLRAFAGLPMFDGVLLIVFRCALGAFAVILGVIWIWTRRSKK